MKIASRNLEMAHLTANEKALLLCEAALALKDRGDYEGVRQIMKPLWQSVGQRPDVNALHSSVAAEVLLTVGILTCWIGNKGQSKQAQESAKDLIVEGMKFFESIADVKKIAAARSELAYCYWCEGALHEARILFQQATEKLTA
jgi:hypothetical protein